jgi:hypothetical protein
MSLFHEHNGMHHFVGFVKFVGEYVIPESDPERYPEDRFFNEPTEYPRC